MKTYVDGSVWLLAQFFILITIHAKPLWTDIDKHIHVYMSFFNAILHVSFFHDKMCCYIYIYILQANHQDFVKLRSDKKEKAQRWSSSN